MIRIGPAGWTHPRMEGVWPADRGADFDPLTFLGARFGCIEVDATAHGAPPRAHVSRWAVALGDAPRTRLTVRLPDALMTLAPAATSERERIVGELQSALQPLLGRPRLAALVGVLPPGGLAGAGELRALAAIARGLRGAPLVLEAPHPSWHEPRGRDGASGAGWILADLEPPADAPALTPALPRRGALAMLRVLREGAPDVARAQRLAARAHALASVASEVIVVAAQRGGPDPPLARVLTALAIKRALAPDHTPPPWPELARAAAPPRPTP